MGPLGAHDGCLLIRGDKLRARDGRYSLQIPISPLPGGSCSSSTGGSNRSTRPSTWPSSSAATSLYAFPSREVLGPDGEWRTAFANIGASAGKNKFVVVDLTDQFSTDKFLVRMATNMEIYWDEIFFSTDGELPHRLAPLSLVDADLHARGYSRAYTESANGPTLFDYDQVTTETRWRPMEGLHTRYGDVLPLLVQPDDMDVTLGAGEELTVEFAAASAPALEAGWVRDYVIFTEGWIKEAEIQGALAQTLEPLVFHGMSGYPYGPDEAYPDDEAHRAFREEYMTREVIGESYREQVQRYVASHTQ